MKYYHLNFNIDKKIYSDFFWKNYYKGEWYRFELHEKQNPKLIWWKLYEEVDKFTVDLQHELNIFGMNNFPRYQYQFPNTYLPYHLDEDQLTGIMFNLRSKEITINYMQNNKSVSVGYQALVSHVGNCLHAVYPDQEARLVLKFSIRHPWEEVLERLDKKNLLLEGNNPLTS